MTATDVTSEVVARARAEIQRLSTLRDTELSRAKVLVDELRRARQFGVMVELAESVRRVDPDDAKNRRLLAQGLIEMGQLTVALDVLRAVQRGMPASHPERAESAGLIGRAHKQIFADAGDRQSPAAREALLAAIAAYRAAFEKLGLLWHGVNLLALVHAADREGVRVPRVLQAKAIAAKLTTQLSNSGLPRDEWYSAMAAETALATGDWPSVESHVRAFAADAANAFVIASTLRQFTQIWRLDDDGADPRARGLVHILRARLLELPGGSLQLTPHQIGSTAAPVAGQLEALLGTEGIGTVKWWEAGLRSARSVAAVRVTLGERIGTGFLVRAGDLGLPLGDEPVLLTNYHVVNEHGIHPGIRPADAQVVFEAVSPTLEHAVTEILWQSPPDRHDACVVRLSPAPDGIPPLPIAPVLPTVEPSARVYVIGHPGGRSLSFSFQDNELLDHEGPTSGKPAVAGLVRLHYRAPTEGGSSGSPVFNKTQWAVIGLHHSGGTHGIPRLNGSVGTYAANEGISVLSIIDAIRASARNFLG